MYRYLKYTHYRYLYFGLLFLFFGYCLVYSIGFLFGILVLVGGFAFFYVAC